MPNKTKHEQFKFKKIKNDKTNVSAQSHHGDDRVRGPSHDEGQDRLRRGPHQLAVALAVVGPPPVRRRPLVVHRGRDGGELVHDHDVTEGDGDEGSCANGFCEKVVKSVKVFMEISL